MCPLLHISTIELHTLKKCKRNHTDTNYKRYFMPVSLWILIIAFQHQWCEQFCSHVVVTVLPQLASFRLFFNLYLTKIENTKNKRPTYLLGLKSEVLETCILFNGHQEQLFLWFPKRHLVLLRFCRHRTTNQRTLTCPPFWTCHNHGDGVGSSEQGRSHAGLESLTPSGQ